MARWATTEGSSFPLGVSGVADEDAYNFALYSTFAERFDLASVFSGNSDGSINPTDPIVNLATRCPFGPGPTSWGHGPWSCSFDEGTLLDDHPRTISC